MSDTNVVYLKGRIGNVDIRKNNVVNLNLATSTYYKDKETGETKSKTEWHRCICFNSLGVKAMDLGIAKGNRVAVTGSLRLNVWKDQNKVEHKTVEIIAKELELLVNLEKKEKVQTNTVNQNSGQGNNAPPDMQLYKRDVPIQAQAQQGEYPTGDC